MELVKRGDRVSLNIRKRLYYFQGARGINLKVDGEESTIIPEDIDDKNLQRINYSIRLEQLISGGTPEKTKPSPKDDKLGEALYQGRNKIEDVVYGIRMDKSIKDEEKITKLEKLLKLEQEGKNKAGKSRVSVITKIEYALSKIAGISPVVSEEGEEKIEISFTKGTEENKQGE